MKKIKLTLKGSAPLLMHNERLANPRDEHAVRLKALTSQRKKTPELSDQIARAEWFGGLYEHDGRVVLPADNVLAALKEGARKRKLGRQAEAGVFATQRYFYLEYDGPTDLEALWADGRFLDFRSVGIGQRRVMRARPRFDEWSVTVELAFDPEIISGEDVIEALETAGLTVGLCEKRPQFGRFSVDVA